VFQSVPGCCTQDYQCNDKDICTLDYCVDNACKNYFNPKWIGYYDECSVPTCGPCKDQPDDPVCGTDGVTYVNYCTLANCPKVPSTALHYVGACLNTEFCPQCMVFSKDPVCGTDGVTYANKCAAIDCVGMDLDHSGRCCPECDGVVENPVCGEDFNTYPNDCTLLCLGLYKKYDGPCVCDCDLDGPEVCGDDGNTYFNQCWLDCLGKGLLYEGPCQGDCPQCPKVYDPVCGKIGYYSLTFTNQCFLECWEATLVSQGVCSDCEAICGEHDNPKPGFDEPACGEDGIEYPSSCFPEKCHHSGDPIGFTVGPCT